MAKYVRKLRIEAESHKLTLTKGQSSVSVHFKANPKSTPSTIWWDFQSLFPNMEKRVRRKVGNVVFEVCERFEGALSLNEYYCDFKETEIGAAAISKHFQYLFHGPLHFIITPSVYKNLNVLFGEAELQNCHTVELCGAEMTNKKTLKQVFDKLRIEKKLIVRPPTDHTYVIQQAFEVEELRLKSSTWLTREHLLKVNCRIAQLNYTRFDSEDIEELGKKWLTNKESKLERLRIEWNSDEEFRLKNLETKRWNIKIREPNYLYFEKQVPIRINCSNGYDLKRDDGKIATIALEDTNENVYIHFLVWNDLFPEQRRLEQLPEKLFPFYKQLERINKDYPDASSLERLLSRRDLTVIEFVDTLRIFRNMYAENIQERSVGTVCRKAIFDEMINIINI